MRYEKRGKINRTETEDERRWKKNMRRNRIARQRNGDKNRKGKSGKKERDRGGSPTEALALGTTRPVSKTRRAKPEGKGEEGERATSP